MKKTRRHGFGSGAHSDLAFILDVSVMSGWFFWMTHFRSEEVNYDLSQPLLRGSEMNL